MPKSWKSKPERQKEIWAKTGGRCAHCGKYAKGPNRTIDHILPRSEGGGYDMRNLMPSCRQCNYTRRSEMIDPAAYYVYAPEWAIQECLDYIAEQNGEDWKPIERLIYELK